MGTFVSSRQVRQNINLMTPWWLSGASIDLDFDNGRYYDSSLGGSASLAPLNSYLSISRASTGYARKADGTLQNFGNDTLRITDIGLLCEDARTNYVNYSSQPDQWAQEGTLAITTNTTVAPDGSTTADTATIVQSGTQAYRYGGAGSIPALGTTSWTFSIWLKGNAGDKIALRTQGTPAAYSVVTLTTSWARYSFTASVDMGGFAIWGVDARTAVDASLGGTFAFQMWGAQLEAATFASSEIPTAGSSAARAADSISITGRANTLINAATGSIIARMGNTAGGSFAANVIDSNGTNCLGFNAGNNGLASITATLATSNTGNRSSADDSLGLGWAASARSLVLNGGTVATDTTSQTPSATQKLGSASGSSNFIYSYVERLTIWNSKLADATLQSLTTP